MYTDEKKNTHILLVDKQKDLITFIKRYLEQTSCRITITENGKEVLNIIMEQNPDLIIISLPDHIGVELYKQIREISTKPVLFLNEKSFDIGVISNLLHKGINQNIIKISSLTLNLIEHTLHINGRQVFLSPKEFSIFELLAKNPNTVFSLAQLYKCVWGVDNIGDTRTVMVHIRNLRKKIEHDPSRPKLIITVKGVGYKLDTSNMFTNQNLITFK